mmetsp:Transcript_47231/g.146133  ORF Transcript_47231/g.146133 Transcript_47231/m.146133 type:complete len:374 (-) Transcript_47231:559-1680(-)
MRPSGSRGLGSEVASTMSSTWSFPIALLSSMLKPSVRATSWRHTYRSRKRLANSLASSTPSLSASACSNTADRCSGEKDRSGREQSSGTFSRKATKSAWEALPSAALGPIVANSSSFERPALWQCSLSAPVIILVMLATTKVLPPSTTSGAAAVVAFSKSASLSCTFAKASCKMILATSLCSWSLAAVLALSSSASAALTRPPSFVSSAASMGIFLSFCRSARKRRASSTRSPASCAAVASFSMISWAASCERPSALSGASGPAASWVFLTASSAVATLAMAFCCIATTFRPSVSALNCSSFSTASSFLLTSTTISSMPALDTASSSALISGDFEEMKLCAALMAWSTTAAAASESARAFSASAAGRISMPLR